MKRILLPTAIASLLVAASCTDKKPQPSVEPTPIDTLLADWDEQSAPMAIHQDCTWDEEKDELISLGLRHVFSSEEDSALYTPLAETYHTLVGHGQATDIRFTGMQENAKEWGSLIYGMYAYCMKGLNYKGTDETSGFAFNDAFMQTHELLSLKYPENAAPKYLLDSLSLRYGNQVRSSYTCALSEDETFVLYSVQMEPKDGKCLGMRVVKADGELYIYEEWCEEYNDQSAWHVDDGGEYYPFEPIAVTRGAKGYDIFYYEGAPESSTYAALLLRNGKFEDYQFACYYNAVDYTPTPDPTTLPEGSELKAELDGYKVWIHTDVQPTEEDPMGQYSVYYSKPESRDVYFVTQTCGSLDPVSGWAEEYKMWIQQDELMGASEAYVVKHPEWNNYYLIVEGCPDARNTYSYITFLPIGTITPSFRWLRTKSGFQGLDETGKLMKFATYGYHEEGGRYGIMQYYDFDFNKVKEEEVEE